MESKYLITLTANASIPTKTGITLVRGDSGQKLEITVNGIDVSSTTAKIAFNRPSAVSVESAITAVNGVYSYEIKGNELSVPGIVVADLKFYSGTKRISTASFIFNVVDDTMDGAHTPTGVVDKSQIEEWADEAKAGAETATAKATIATNAANTATSAATSASTSATNAATSESNAATSASTASTAAATATEKAAELADLGLSVKNGIIIDTWEDN